MKFLAIAVALSVAPLADAIIASPASWTAHQPDQNSVGAVQKLEGTPGYHYTVIETEDSFYTTIKDHSDDYIKYAMLDPDTGYLVPSEYIVGSVDPVEVGIQERILEDVAAREDRCSENNYCNWHRDNNGGSHSSPPVGQYMNLVIPFKFADHAERDLNIAELESGLFNDDELSVKDYFEKQSYGKLSIVNEFAPEVIISRTELECADNKSGLSYLLHDCLREALQGKYINDFDTITFVHSGYAAEYGDQDEYDAYFDDRIWSHSWEIESEEYSGRYALISAFYGTENARVNRVGVAVHEIAQAMGAPTMYGESIDPGYGLGYYDVMSNPWGFDGTLYRCGSMSAYTKQLFEWNKIEEIDEEGMKSIEASTISPKVYKISDGFPTDEYLLIENRVSADYDMGMRQPGLAIYHIDETANNLPGHPEDGNDYPLDHYRVSIIQADGRFDLERGEDEGDMGDLFHGDRFSGFDSNGPFDSAGERMTRESDGEPRTFPNTKSYRDGQLAETDLKISDISLDGESMQFSVYYETSSS